MKPIVIPNLWTTPHGFHHRDRLRSEATKQARAHGLPISPGEVSAQLSRAKEAFFKKLHLPRAACPLDLQYHGEDIAMQGYTVRRLSFQSAPRIRVTGNLYVPEGSGPFPAVLNMHGHWNQGKLAAHIQTRGHILAQNGFVVLTVDAAGAGERGEVERVWSYHGSWHAAELFLGGDSLLGLQVRDNQTALDVLQSLAFVDGERIGATGASGGGNQTMWLSALDERVKASVPVVSVGSFEEYVGNCNCMCETMPGGLKIAEEWGVLGLIAPRPLLVINALHDQPSFSYKAMTPTCRQVQEIYAMKDARDRFDSRLIDITHGYFAEPQHAMLGWMKRWLTNDSSPANVLPDWTDIPEELLTCYPPGQRPDECSYRLNREVLCVSRPESEALENPAEARVELAELIGWQAPTQASEWAVRRTLPSGIQVGAIKSSRGTMLPVVMSGALDSSVGEVCLILSPDGKKSPFVSRHWAAATEKGVLAVSLDLPGVGELSWDTKEVIGMRFHDSSRACLWLGYTLVAEWAEIIATVALSLKAKSPESRLRIVAEKEMVFAALLCQALHSSVTYSLTESECPVSVKDPANTSIAWCVPGFLSWGDIGTVRQLAEMSQKAAASIKS